MNKIYKQIQNLANPYLNTRQNDIHTNIALKYSYNLLKKEKGNPKIIIPGIILHDIGWKTIPEEMQLLAFGPNASNPELNKQHETKGAIIAKEILESINYNKEYINEIFEIIEGHDSRQTALSLNDQIIKDSDKLWRYSKEGLNIDMKRFNETFQEAMNRIEPYIESWFFTKTAKLIAKKELKKRYKEYKKNLS